MCHCLTCHYLTCHYLTCHYLTCHYLTGGLGSFAHLLPNAKQKRMPCQPGGRFLRIEKKGELPIRSGRDGVPVGRSGTLKFLFESFDSLGFGAGDVDRFGRIDREIEKLRLFVLTVAPYDQFPVSAT